MNEIERLFWDIKWLYALLQICGVVWWCLLAVLFVLIVGADRRARRKGQGHPK